jgi:hypothetical protein
MSIGACCFACHALPYLTGYPNATMTTLINVTTVINGQFLMMLTSLCEINLDDSWVWLDNTSYPPTAILSFPRAKCPRTTMTTSQDVAPILIGVFNHKGTMMEYCILCQPNLHRLHGLKYNTLLYNHIVMINERHTIIEPKTFSYSLMCLTQVPAIWYLKSIFH